ncbi:MAG: hypothetical protein ACFE9D_09805 [Promethearchaeota archaeon]
MVSTYKVHKLPIDMNHDKQKLEDFLNTLKGTLITIIPAIGPDFPSSVKTSHLWIIEEQA